MTTYQPRYRVTGSTTWINFGSPLSSSTFTATVTGLAAGTQYDFDILEIDSFGSTPSATVTTTTLTTTVTESTEGTAITQSNFTTQKIYDANLLQWSMTSGFQVATSPSPYSTVTTDTTTSSVLEILFHNATVFYENTSNQWFYWTGNDPWVPTIDIIGPVLVGGLSSPTFTVGASGINLGAITVTKQGSPSFSGSFSITGTDSAFFTITSGNLVTTQTTSARTYSINITATQANVVGSPLTTAFSIVGSASLESAEGYTVTTAGPIVYASETMGVADTSGPWNQFALVAATGTNAPFTIVETGGGTAGTGGGNVVALVYHNHTLFQHATDSSTFDGWWYWNTTSSAYTFFAISSVALSNLTIAASSPASTVVGTLSAVMSDGSTFAGTYTVSDTTHFKIVGASLETAVANLSGSYPITIGATPSVVGNAYVSAYGATPGQTFTITAGTQTAVSYTATPPASLTLTTGAVSPLGWTVDFFDDFNGTFTPISTWGFSTGALYHGAPMQYIFDAPWGGYAGSNGDTSGAQNNSNITMSGSNLNFNVTLSGGKAQVCSCYTYMDTNWGLWEASIKCATAANGANSVGPDTGIWLSGSNWPTEGEWDILESSGSAGGYQMFIHLSPTQSNDVVPARSSGNLPSGNIYDGSFHVWQALMTPAYLALYIDGTQVWTSNSSSLLNHLTTATNPPKATAPGSFGYQNNPYGFAVNSSPSYNWIFGLNWNPGQTNAALFPAQAEFAWVRHSILNPSTGGVHV